MSLRLRLFKIIYMDFPCFVQDNDISTIMIYIDLKTVIIFVEILDIYLINSESHNKVNYIVGNIFNDNYYFWDLILRLCVSFRKFFIWCFWELPSLFLFLFFLSVFSVPFLEPVFGNGCYLELMLQACS